MEVRSVARALLMNKSNYLYSI